MKGAMRWAAATTSSYDTAVTGMVEAVGGWLGRAATGENKENTMYGQSRGGYRISENEVGVVKGL